MTPDEQFSLVVQQYQPDDKTCAHTCLAMILGASVKDVIAVTGPAAMTRIDLWHFLRQFCVVHTPLVYDRFIVTGWYLVTVPSLNHEGGSHIILVFYNDDSGTFRVLDPNPVSRRRYVEDGSNLRATSQFIFVKPGGCIRRE